MCWLHRRRQVAATLVWVLSLTGCGTTQLIANDPQAFIIVDGIPRGQGIASVTKVGFPGSAQVIAQTDDGRQTQQTMSRSFAWTTALFGLFTYGICLIACWEYPETVFLYLPQPPVANRGAPPGSPIDPWLLPPTGWKN